MLLLYTNLGSRKFTASHHTEICHSSLKSQAKSSSFAVQWFCSKSNSKVVAVENRKLRLQKDVSIDRKANTSIALNSSIASCSAVVCGRIVYECTWDNCFIGANSESERRKRCRARKCVATLAVVVLGAGDLAVVRGNNRIVQEK